jgi:homoserine kinase
MRTKLKKVRAIAPATVANVSCGFDVFGFAVDNPVDEVEVSATKNNAVSIKKIDGDNARLSLDPAKNTAGVAVLEFLKAIDCNEGVEISLTKNLPLGSGMGSSAASSVAALVAINALYGEPLTRRELLPFAMEAERVACGSAHADNVAPSLLGGFILIRGYQPLDVVSIPTPEKLFVTLAHPHLELKTEDARQIMRSSISMKDAITQWGNIAGLIAGLMKPDFGLIGRSIQDVVAEPVRAMLIPGFDQIKQSAIDAGALGCGISGSGPTLFALSTERELARRIGEVMKDAFRRAQLETDIYISTINQTGARIIYQDNLKF